jgi:hypothetical protein
MNRSSKGPRTRQRLSESFMSKVNAYALAAGAAGVAVVALAQPSEAEIIYTPANETIPRNRHLSLDMNHDGTPDVGFFFYIFAYHSFRDTLNVGALGDGGVIAGAAGYASPLFKGFGVGAGRVFAAGSQRMERSSGIDYEFYHRRIYGPWANQINRYLGVAFIIDGATHYGWIRLSVTIAQYEPMTATVTGYAYETVANQSIHAGQLSDEASAPAESAPLAKPSLGVLALGSQGMALWRRQDSSVLAE